MTLHPSFLPYRQAASYCVENLLQGLPSPDMGIVCGTGFSSLGESLQEPVRSVSYDDIPGFPSCTVPGHPGRLVYGRLGADGPAVLCFQGRFHLYEGHDASSIVLPIRLLRCLNVRVVILTNASGALNPSYRPGDIVCMTDHVGLPLLAGGPGNPLTGPNDDELGERFIDTTSMYATSTRHSDPRWRSIVLAVANENGLGDVFHPSGVYCYVGGPHFETPTEGRFLRSMGGDCVGMSTAPEALAAHHAGLKILAFSVVTNAVPSHNTVGAETTHEEVMRVIAQGATAMQALIQGVAKRMQNEILSSLSPLPEIDLVATNKDKEGGDQF